MSPFQCAKMALVHSTGLNKDALHVYFGLGVMIGAAALWRRSLADWRPIGAVLLVVLAGEAWDMADAAFTGTRQYWAGNWKDIWNTLFWPLTLLLLARFSPILKR